MKILGCVKNWRSAEWGLVFLLVVSLALKITILSFEDVLNVDGVRYIDAAREFAAGNFREGLSIEKMPFYPLLIVGFHFLIRDWVLAGQLISLLAMVFALVPLFLLTKGLFDENVAFWAGLAFVLSPMLNARAVDLIRDPIFLFFVAWSIYLFWRALTVLQYRYFFIVSVSCVFALLCRIEGVFLFAVFGLVLGVLALKKGPERRLLLKGMMLFIGFPLLVGLLSAGILMLTTGTMLGSLSRLGEIAERLQSVVNGDFLAMYHSLYAQLKAFRNTAAVGTRGSLVNTARHYIPLIYLLSLAEALARNLFLLYVIPLWVGCGKRAFSSRGHWLVLFLTCTYFLVAYYFLFTHDFMSKRYLLVPALLLFPWVGRGLERMRSAIGGCRWPKMAMVLFLLVFCAIPAYKSLGDVIRPGKGNVIKVAGQWLARQPDLQKTVAACSDPRIRFYTSPDITFVRQMENMVVAKDFNAMEMVALDHMADLLIIETSKSKRCKIPDFKHFSLMKEFVGVKNDVLIYGSKI